mgnify:CR=1 FL=1
MKPGSTLGLSHGFLLGVMQVGGSAGPQHSAAAAGRCAVLAHARHVLHHARRPVRWTWRCAGPLPTASSRLTPARFFFRLAHPQACRAAPSTSTVAHCLPAERRCRLPQGHQRGAGGAQGAPKLRAAPERQDDMRQRQRRHHRSSTTARQEQPQQLQRLQGYKVAVQAGSCFAPPALPGHDHSGTPPRLLLPCASFCVRRAWAPLCAACMSRARRSTALASTPPSPCTRYAAAAAGCSSSSSSRTADCCAPAVGHKDGSYGACGGTLPAGLPVFPAANHPAARPHVAVQDATGTAADIAVGWAIGVGAPFAFCTTLESEYKR